MRLAFHNELSNRIPTSIATANRVCGEDCGNESSGRGDGMPTRKATLALGGGGARGLAHLGAIEEIVRAGWGIERIVGISIGSLAGAMFAFDQDIDVVQRRALDFLLSPEFARKQRELFSAGSTDDETSPGGMFGWYHGLMGYLQSHQKLIRATTRRSFLPSAFLEDVVTHLLPDADLADAVIPIGVAAADLRTGLPVVLERGSVRDAVRASAALPGIFPPVEIGDYLLCDLGVVAALPTRLARQLSKDPVIAIDVAGGLQPLDDCPTAMDVLTRVMDIGECTFRADLRAEADLLIVPDVSRIHWADFSQSQRLIELGRIAARKTLEQSSLKRSWLHQIWETWHGVRRVKFP